MKRHHLLFATLACTFLIHTAASAQSCTPPGLLGNGDYEYIANGAPANSNCWTLTGNVSVVTTTDCGQSQKAFDMHYGARVVQQFTVPSTETRTHWDLNYLLTMQDPNDDGWWNRLKATVYDVTTGQNLASQTYWGDDPDITCVRRDLTFTGNVAGHTLQVIFADGSSYGNTHIRVRGVSLLQY